MKTRGTAVALIVIIGKCPPQIDDFEGWKEPKKILVILAHPDDPEFFCGATLIRWAKAGHEIAYCLLTKGQRGSRNLDLSIGDISAIRVREQKAAANFIGVKNVEFLNEMDGELEPSLRLREEVVSKIRKYTPQIIITSDPQNYVSLENRLNHPDHRAAGEIALGAVFPAAGNPQIYKANGDETMGNPINPEEIWISATNQPNLVVDISDYFEEKLKAILFHQSQIEDKNALVSRMRKRAIVDCETQKMMFVERFKRVIQ